MRIIKQTASALTRCALGAAYDEIGERLGGLVVLHISSRLAEQAEEMCTWRDADGNRPFEYMLVKLDGSMGVSWAVVGDECVVFNEGA